MLVHRKLISICQITHVYLCFDSDYVMFKVLPSDNIKKEAQEKKNVKDTTLIVLSDYTKNLESHVHTRYLQKIAVIGVDPACLQGEKLDAECLPPIEATDLLSYLVLETSYYNLEQFKAFKSLDSYNQMVSGFITSVQGKIIGNKFVVLGKVRHSQRMNEPPIPIWIIANSEGTIISAHCLGCKAGLSECCSHVGSVLFYIEAWNRINGKLACTQVKCTWLLPTYVNEVPYAQVQDINFKSARKLKAELDDKIDGVESSTNSAGKTVKPVSKVIPSETEMNTFFSKLNESKKKPVILSLVPSYADQFVLKSRRVPTLPTLYVHENLKLNYPELLQKCCEVELSLSDSDIELIEQETRDQSQGTAFFKHRAGRIGASISYSVANTNPAQPSIFLIKSICYPQLFRVNSKAINHGVKNEGKAIEAYNNIMSANHKDFALKTCGVFIDKEHPWMHATPDFLSTCSCCGDGCGEVKCPYTLENWDFESYALKKSSCLEKVDGNFRLKRKHQYYYQVQQQLFITGRQFCDFVVCAFNDNKPKFFMERIFPDTNHWDAIVPKVTKVWRTCILPEIVARWYTRKQHLPELQPAKKSSGICYCRMHSQESTLHCSNPKCLIKEFHHACLHISDPVPIVWYCPNCRVLAEFKSKKPKKASKASSAKCPPSDEALKLDSICVCGSSPKVNERLLKCHSDNCKNGTFFHLHCLDYKRMPNNSKTTWKCSNCKVSQATKATTSSSTGPTTCSSYSTCNSANAASTTSSSENSVQLTQAAKGDIDKGATLSNNANAATTSYVSSDSSDDESDAEITQITKGVIDKRANLGSLVDSHFDIINSPTGWLDCTIIQQAQVYLQIVNPLIESFQKTTLGPVRNFDIVTSEFVQVLHTGHMHWVCISSIGCKPGIVNLYDSLYHDIIEKEVEEQVESLMADSYIGIVNVPVQQQLNGSDCGVFAIAFSTCLVYGFNPRDFTFDIPKMRPHLADCLKSSEITMFPIV